tara:strand:+ start:28 stop:384 length:357 start_codon:yes stop_codon:yes gene_type:complete
MSNVHVDYFKANYISDGKTGHLEINDNGNYVYKRINEDEKELMKLINICNREQCYEKNLLERLKEEFPVDEEAPKKGKTLKNNKRSSSKEKKSKSKKGKKRKSRKSTTFVDSIRNVFK